MPVNMARKGGLRGLLNLYDRAAQKLYRPRNYTEEDYLHGLLLWRLGGARLAGIGHRALGLPSETTLRRHRVLPPLLVSPSSPKLNEVEENVQNVFAPIQTALTTAILRVVHQVLMLDELKVEERPRYDEKTDKIYGIYREHSRDVTLDFVSEKEVELLLEGIKKDEVHLAVDVC